MKNFEHLGMKGEGYFCIVKKYREQSSGREFALKELKKAHYPIDGYRYRMIREINILKELQGCDNIIELLDSGQDFEKEKLWYLMPFANQNLYDYIKINNNTLAQKERYQLVEQVINAIKFAHDKNILHRDISPNNVLVFHNEKKIALKVCDFGLGKDKLSLSYYTKSSASGYGQILYVSPEQRNKLKDATKKSDIYSLGKLVYFIFTGKDPDNIKQFELSSLVSKSTEDNPENRFNDIHEFEKHFLSIKELQLNQKVDIKYLTLSEVLESLELSWVELHEILVEGNYIEHVYSDYIEPVNRFLLFGNNLYEYYSSIGNAIRDFAKTYSDRLNDCYQTFGWPFTAMSTFGTVLIKIIQTVSDDETRLICLKQLWYLAFEADQWKVQSKVKDVFTGEFIPASIETQLAEYIFQAKTKVELSHFNNSKVPKLIRSSIIKSNTSLDEAQKERREEQKLGNESYDW